MIEVAYELLQDEGSTDGGLSSQTETAEEFAERCGLDQHDCGLHCRDCDQLSSQRYAEALHV